MTSRPILVRSAARPETAADVAFDYFHRLGDVQPYELPLTPPRISRMVRAARERGELTAAPPPYIP